MRTLALITVAGLFAAGAALAQPPAGPAAAPAPAAPAPAAPAAVAPAAPRVLTAPAGSTIAIALEKGIVLSIMGFDIDIAFKPDGTFDGMEGMFTGTYRVDGEKLCLNSADQGETCTPYPAGKKSGDTFQIETDFGAADVRIR